MDMHYSNGQKIVLLTREVNALKDKVNCLLEINEKNLIFLNSLQDILLKKGVISKNDINQKLNEEVQNLMSEMAYSLLLGSKSGKKEILNPLSKAKKNDNSVCLNPLANLKKGEGKNE